MRAPLVVAVSWLALGIAVGLHRPAPLTGGGPIPWGAVVALLGAAAAGRIVVRARAGTTAGAPTVRGLDRRLPLLLLLAAGVLLGASTRVRADRSCEQWLPDHLPVEVVAVVEGAADAPASGGTRLRLTTRRVAVGGRWLDCRAQLPARLEAPGAPPVGSVVEGTGRWWSPPGATALLRRPGALLLDTLRVAAGDGRAGSPAARLRAAGSARIDAVFPRTAPLVASLLLAQRDGLDPEVRERFARAGLSHLLAISGLHVGLVSGMLLLLGGLLRRGRRSAAVVAAVGTVGYVALLGAPHSAARAALQIVLVLAARAAQRPTRTEALIAAAAMALLAVDPGALLQPGFQLSFAGVAGILALRRPLLRRLAPLASLRAGRLSGRWVADGLATSLAATVMTAPIVAWHFGRVAPVGILANLVAIPLLAAVVPALAAALLAGSVWLPAGRFLAGTGELLLGTLDRVAAAAAAAPFGTVAVQPVAALVMTAAVGAGYLLSRRLGTVRPGIRAAVWAGVAGAVLVVAPVRPAGDAVELHMIDVGQGDAIAIRSPGNRWLLVDAGVARNDYDAGARRVVPYLARRGVRRLDALIITHPDADHMGGAGAVVAALRPRWVGGPAAVVGKPGYLALLEAARADRVPWVAVQRGMELELDGMRLRFLYPDRSGRAVEDANDASVVLHVEYGDFAALLTGDAPAAVEERLVRRFGRLDADVLKIGHHGSSTSTTTSLLTATGARTALISAGRGNRYGHPHGTVLARLREAGLAVYRTDRHGSVVVRGDAAGNLRVRSERGGEP